MGLFGRLENGIANYIGSKVYPENPDKFLLAQADSLVDMLPYDSFFPDQNRTVFTLSDGAIGAFYEVALLPHEAMSERDLKDSLENVSKIFTKLVGGDRATLQFIYDSEPSEEFGLPNWYGDPDTYARRVICKRIDAIKDLANNPGKRPLLVKRRLFASLRVETDKKPTVSSCEGGKMEDYLDEQASIIEECLVILRENCEYLETLLSKADMPFVNLGAAALTAFVRRSLNSLDATKRNPVYFSEETPINARGRLSNGMVRDMVEWSPDAVSVSSEDTWEVLSWSDKPATKWAGMMAEVLREQIPLRIVVSIRPGTPVEDLDKKSDEVENEIDKRQERQKKDLEDTLERMMDRESLADFSMHIFVRNTNLPMNGKLYARKGKKFAAFFSDFIPCFVEKTAALPIFLSSLPLASSRKTACFVCRDLRVLSGDISYLLPILGGARGNGVKSMLMQARSGEAIWMSPRASGNPHFVVVGSSGGGKSFFTGQMLISDLAYMPNVMIYIVDSITSYENLCRAIGEEVDVRVVKPPESFPNIFKGELTLDDGTEENSTIDRKTMIRDIIVSAVSIVSDLTVTSQEETLLDLAIERTYEDNMRAANHTYVPSDDPESLGEYVVSDGAVEVPRLSQVVQKFAQIAAENAELGEKIASELSFKLIPLYGTGPYSNIFDQVDTMEREALAPTITLYDLCNISSDRLRRITSLIITQEFEILKFNAVNRYRPGMFIMEEAGVNLGSNPVLTEYWSRANQRYRKAKTPCGTIVPSPSILLEEEGPRISLALADNVITLPMTSAANKGYLQKVMEKDDPTKLAVALSTSIDYGSHSEIFWKSEKFTGSFTFTPTGYDYWHVANESEDLQIFRHCKRKIGSYQGTVRFLAEFWPMGVRQDNGMLVVPDESVFSRLDQQMQQSGYIGGACYENR